MRVKRGFASRRRHNKIRKMASGYQNRRNNVFKFAKNAVEHGMQYAYIGRKLKKREYRVLWIARISAACKMADISYSKFMNGLTRAGMSIDRKSLADLAMNDYAAFAQIVQKAKSALAVAA